MRHVSTGKRQKNARKDREIEDQHLVAMPAREITHDELVMIANDYAMQHRRSMKLSADVKEVESVESAARIFHPERAAARREIEDQRLISWEETRRLQA